jgi:hypothetical protein
MRTINLLAVSVSDGGMHFKICVDKRTEWTSGINVPIFHSNKLTNKRKNAYWPEIM